MSVNLSGKHTTFINRAVSSAVQFKAAYDQMVALRAEWDAMAYSTGITDADFATTNTYMNAVILGNFFTTQGNLASFWASGNGTNVCSVMP